MMTSSSGNIFRVTGHLCVEFTGHRWNPHTKPAKRSFEVFDLHLNKRLSKQWWGWWFEAPLCPLWRHCNETHRISRSSGRAMGCIPWGFRWKLIVLCLSSVQAGDICRSLLKCRNENVVILTKFSSLAAMKVVQITTFSAHNDGNFIQIAIFTFKWQISMLWLMIVSKNSSRHNHQPIRSHVRQTFLMNTK